MSPKRLCLQLLQATNNKDVYNINIKLLLNSVVTFKTSHTKRTILQYMRCQRYGPTKNVCHKKPHCVKINHVTKD